MAEVVHPHRRVSIHEKKIYMKKKKKRKEFNRPLVKENISGQDFFSGLLVSL